MTVINSILLGSGAAALGYWYVENSRRIRRPVEPGYQGDITLPHKQPFELYHNPFSLCSMKTRVCLAELGIDYRSHHVDLIETGAYENIRPRLLAVNPAGTVPVLVHNGHPIYESHEQIRYAAKHAPEGSQSLIPEDAELRRQMHAWIDRSSLTEDPINSGDLSAGNAVAGMTLQLFSSMIQRVPYWKIMEGVLFHFDKRRSLVFMLLKLLGLQKFRYLKPAMEIHKRSGRQMALHLDGLETQLVSSGGPWILGSQFTLADVSWLVIFERLQQADTLGRFLDGGSRQACKGYWDKFRARPSYTAAIKNFSHPMVQYGTKNLQQAKKASPKLQLALVGQ